MTFSKRYQEVFLRKLFLVLKNKWNVICVCAYGDEKAEQLRVQMLAIADLSGAFPMESYLAQGLPPGCTQLPPPEACTLVAGAAALNMPQTHAKSAQ